MENNEMFRALLKIANHLKLANLIPLFKKGERNDWNNYCAVSNLSWASKILERNVFKHLFYYLCETVISKDQSGFQLGDSTDKQLTFIITFVKR